MLWALENLHSSAIALSFWENVLESEILTGVRTFSLWWVWIVGMELAFCWFNFRIILTEKGETAQGRAHDCASLSIGYEEITICPSVGIVASFSTVHWETTRILQNNIHPNRLKYHFWHPLHPRAATSSIWILKCHYCFVIFLLNDTIYQQNPIIKQFLFYDLKYCCHACIIYDMYSFLFTEFFS